jgi:hypothetical protein
MAALKLLFLHPRWFYRAAARHTWRITGPVILTARQAVLPSASNVSLLVERFAPTTAHCPALWYQLPPPSRTLHA